MPLLGGVSPRAVSLAVGSVVDEANRIESTVVHLQTDDLGDPFWKILGDPEFWKDF